MPAPKVYKVKGTPAVCDYIIMHLCVMPLFCPLLYLCFCLSAYKWMHGELRGNVPLQYLAWVTYPMILVMFASLFCNLVSPQAIGTLSITPIFYDLIFPFYLFVRTSLLTMFHTFFLFQVLVSLS